MSRPKTLCCLALLLLLWPGAPGWAQPHPDRSHPPLVGPPPSLTPPAVQKRTLSNGIPVWIVERHQVPVVSVDLVLSTGSSADPEGKYGAASLTAAMLDEGAGNLTSLQLADELDYLGASLDAGANFDATSVDLYVPTARLEPALRLMADVVLRPSFPEAELKRLQVEWLVDFQQDRDDPTEVARAAYPRILFGTAHRYGTPGSGTAVSIAGLARRDLVDFYSSHYWPEQAAFIVVGDIDPEAVTAQLESLFGGWRANGPSPVVSLPAPAQRSGREIVLVDKPGAAQSAIRIGWVGVARDTPDYFPLAVMNTILGGSFTSRLNQNLREEHGYTYGARSGFDMRRLPGPFVAAAAVQTDKTAPAVREFFKELEGMRRPVPEDELTRARNNLAYGYPSEFETTSDVAGELAEVMLYGLGDDHFARYVDRVLGVSAADVQRVAERYVQPENFAVVIVGDVKAIRPGLEALKLGPVRVVTLDEVLGPLPAEAGAP